MALMVAASGSRFLGRLRETHGRRKEKYLASLDDAWGEFLLVRGKFRDLDERVLMLGRIEGRGRGSGVQVETPDGVIYDFRDRKISRVHACLDHGGALRAAGLTE